jgi:altronate dehydratase small subunit
MYSQKELIIMNETDNVGIVKEGVAKEQVIILGDGREDRIVEVREDIPFGFKIAVKDINRGDTVFKYGEPIGIASLDITKGEMVHVHNMEGLRGRGDLKS